MKTRTITLTDRRPVKIADEVWPLIAEASDHDGAVEVQANSVWWVRVREHGDGRAIAYAARVAGPGGQHAGFRAVRAGELLSAGDDICAAVTRVAAQIGRPDLGQDCIADLPAEEIR